MDDLTYSGPGLSAFIVDAAGCGDNCDDNWADNWADNSCGVSGAYSAPLRCGGCEDCGCGCDECLPGVCDCGCVVGPAVAPRLDDYQKSVSWGGFTVFGGEAPLAPPGDGRALEAVSTADCECSESAGRAAGEPCSDPRIVGALADFIVEVGSSGPKKVALRGGEDLLPADAAVRGAAAVLGCDSESCAVGHPDFQKFATKQAGLAPAVLKANIEKNFKAPGPRNSTELLSNFHIDETLQRWAETYPDFYNYSFNMIDFEETGDTLARYPPVKILEGKAPQRVGAPPHTVKRRCRRFACVLNTDSSQGRGKHWLALFSLCDTPPDKDWWIAFFNSAGNPPHSSITRWMETAAEDLRVYRKNVLREPGGVKTIALSNRRHQSSQTECGLYALYFIRRCLDGGKPSDFESGRITDKEMTEFRKHIFRKK